MKNLLLLVLGGALLASPSVAQTAQDISIAEFRQTLTDYLTLTDGYRGTNYAPLMASVPNTTLAQWYTGVKEGRRFQQAVSGLKARMEARRNSAAPRGRSNRAMNASPAPRHPLAATESPLSSPFGTIASTPVPDYTLYPPNYPSGTNWSIMTGTLQNVMGGLLPNGDVSNLECDPDGEANLAVVVSTFHGIKDAADQICDAIPDPVVIVLGEGTRIPLKEVCFAIDLIVGAFNSAFDGFYSDCQTQGDLVDGANVQATLNNSIGLYNLEFRLMVEENLGNTTSPMGMFELPDPAGYLEKARAITADIVTNMQYAGFNVAAALAALQAGDNNYNARQYKLAFKQYQTAYGLAVKP